MRFFFLSVYRNFYLLSLSSSLPLLLLNIKETHTTAGLIRGGVCLSVSWARGGAGGSVRTHTSPSFFTGISGFFSKISRENRPVCRVAAHHLSTCTRGKRKKSVDEITLSWRYGIRTSHSTGDDDDGTRNRYEICPGFFFFFCFYTSAINVCVSSTAVVKTRHV